MIDDPLEVYEAPEDWTPEHVMHRMVAAYDVLRRQRVSIGPKGVKAAWPQHWNDWETELDRISLMDGENVEDRDRRLHQDVWDDWSRTDPPDEREISFMEEAITWPGKYLAGLIAERRIAITRWAKARALGHEGGDLGIHIVTAEAEIISGGLVRDRIHCR